MNIFKKNTKRLPMGMGNAVTPDEVTLAREAVNSLSGDFTTGAAQQKLAAKRMTALNKTISKMESALVHTSRLETENAKLSTNVRDVEQKLRQKTAWAEEQEKKLFALKKQRDDFMQRFEDAKVALSQRDDADKAQGEKLTLQMQEIVNLQNQHDQDQDMLEASHVTMQTLQDDVARQSAELSSQRRRLAELKKAFEENEAQLELKSKDNDTAQKDLKVLRVEHADLKEKLFTAQSELQTAKYNVKTQKTLFDDTIKRRDDELVVLKNQIDNFSVQMRIQEDTTSNYEDEIASLRQALDIERDRGDKNELRLRTLIDESERRATAVKDGQQEYDSLHAKFAQAVDDLDTLRKINLAQKGKLERYASITSTSGGSGLIHNDSDGLSARNEDAYRPVLKAVNS